MLKLLSDQAQSTQLANSTSTPKFTRRTLLATALVGWGYWSSSSGQSRSDRQFDLPDFSPTNLNDTPHFENRWIEHESPLGFIHCASLSESASRDLFCAWYGGTREGARDVNVWMSQLNPTLNLSGNNWKAPTSVVDYRQSGQGTGQFVKKVGNALLFHDKLDRLWMIYVSIAMGGWSTSSLNATYSTDGGSTWSASQRLWLSPLFNISELVRCPAITMQDGEVGIPIYHECAGVFPEMLWLRPGNSKLEYRKSRLAGGHEWLQPSIVPTGPRSAICYLRCANESRRVGYQTTHDAGESWSMPELLELANPNSAVCGVLMPDSAVLLALNHSADSRDSMSLVYSANGISDWRVVAVLDKTPDQKYSYPTMIRDRAGTIHLVYSWQMKKLRHISFNNAWVRQQLSQATSTEEAIAATTNKADLRS